MRKIAVIGLGYVGLPVALAFARRFPGTVGFDCDADKVRRLSRGEDPTGVAREGELSESELRITSDPHALRDCDFFIVAVPTPIDAARRPDLSALRSASETVGGALSEGAIVVFESTVYPGATEEDCAPILEQASGLVAGRDFKLGYSPERINPGDPAHRFETIPKVVSAQDETSLEVVKELYGAVVEAGLHVAPSIRVAEAAKVIENVQRDLNIALVNELAMLFHRLGLDTRAVLEAAGSKWNFHRYRPGLVGGHCIGVDPYYLTSKAEAVGFHPQVILAGRRINDGMSAFVAQETIKLLIRAGRGVQGARVALLGLAFKPNVPDLRNSRVPDIVNELVEYGVEVLIHDPLVSAEEARREYDLELVDEDRLDALDAVCLAVPHRELIPLAKRLAVGPRLLVDVMGGVDPSELPDDVRHWRL